MADAQIKYRAPKGWRLVPEEPTREMTMHACAVLPSVDGVSGHAGKLCTEVYKWMLEAAPTPSFTPNRGK